MFLLCCFTNLIVFMNMLIAIMGNTFAEVTAKREISGLQEKVKMINDHIWLINISKLFKGYKYIIRIA